MPDLYVSPLQAVGNVLSGQPAGTANTTSEEIAFKDFLTQAMGNTELTAADSMAYNDALLMGEVSDAHSAIIAAREAELALSLTVQIRDRLVNAYTELMNMQV